jgi:putative transposase
MNDNAWMESFFHSMKAELNSDLAVDSLKDLRRVVGGYITYYNQHRGHTSLAHLSPVEFEGVGC